MDLPPLRYSAGTLTKWHLLAWLAISLIPLASLNRAPPLEILGHCLMGACGFALLYLIAAPLVGQVYGDKFTWSQVWPSVFIVAFLLMTWFCLGFIQDAPNFGLTEAIVILTFGTLWFGICLSLLTWLAPKASAWAPKRHPKKPWGVSL